MCCFALGILLQVAWARRCFGPMIAFRGADSFLLQSRFCHYAQIFLFVSAGAVVLDTHGLFLWIQICLIGEDRILATCVRHIYINSYGGQFTVLPGPRHFLQCSNVVSRICSML